MNTSSTLSTFWKENRLYIFCFMAVWLFGCYLLAFEFPKGDAILWFSSRRNEPLNYFFRFGSYVGEGYVYLMAVIALLFVQYAKSIAIVLNSMLVLISSVSLKAFFKHHRPKRYFEEIINQPDLVNYVPDVVVLDGYSSSFPSGHTTSGFAFYTLLAFFIPNKYAKLVCLAAALLVGISRIYLVQHFLKDVLAGSMLGFLVAMLTYWLTTKFEHRFGGKYIRKKRREILAAQALDESQATKK